mmetsp:Transcript_7890/g.22589  ORF Transcript_7890/g.22589 Transcript_7890/m.22589 type:complete len:116 (+) Transcript_7890:413-760(+)
MSSYHSQRRFLSFLCGHQLMRNSQYDGLFICVTVVSRRARARERETERERQSGISPRQSRGVALHEITYDGLRLPPLQEQKLQERDHRYRVLLEEPAVEKVVEGYGRVLRVSARR